MTLQQLRYAVEIAHTGSITQAAKNLFMGQPNLSRSIKDLEAEIGIRLFQRTPQGVVPTQNSQAFFGYARSILAQMDSLSQLYHEPAQPCVRLHVAVPRASYVSEAFSRYAAGLFSSSADLAYRETNALSVVNDVATGEAELGVLRYQKEHYRYFEHLLLENGLAAQPLFEYSMVVLMHQSHPLALLAEIPYHLLARHVEIVHGDLTPVLPTESAAAAPMAESKRMAVFDRGSQFDILRNLPGSYLWVSPMPFEVLQRHELVQKPCHNATRYQDVVIHPAGQPLSAAAEGLVQALQAEIAQLVRT